MRGLIQLSRALRALLAFVVTCGASDFFVTCGVLLNCCYARVIFGFVVACGTFELIVTRVVCFYCHVRAVVCLCCCTRCSALLLRAVFRFC